MAHVVSGLVDRSTLMSVGWNFILPLSILMSATEPLSMCVWRRFDAKSRCAQMPVERGCPVKCMRYRSALRRSATSVVCTLRRLSSA